MQPDERDAAYLWDMLDAALSIKEFTAEMNYDQYIYDKRTSMAVERAVEIIGEAARNITEDLSKFIQRFLGQVSLANAISLHISILP